VAITKYQRSEAIDDSPEKLREHLQAINDEIMQMTKGLLNAHSVSFKSNFANNSNWLSEIRNKWYVSAANASAKWHQEKLLMLYKNRKIVQTKLEKATGTYWKNTIKRWVKYFSVGIFLITALATISIGFLAAIYLIPTILIIIFIYILFKKYASFR